MKREIREAFADGIEELVTSPELSGAGFDVEAGERVREGERIAWSRMFEDRIVAVAVGKGLCHEDVDALKKEILDERPPVQVE